MSEPDWKDIPAPLRDLYQRGVDALKKGNEDYALTLFTTALQQEPGFYRCRETLRGAQLKKARHKPGLLKKMLDATSSSPLLAKAQIALHSHPKEALRAAEDVLNHDPHNIAALKLSGDAALALDLPRTATLSFELALKHAPADKAAALRLGKALLRVGNHKRSEKVFGELAKLYPTDQDIAQLLKDATAKMTMSDGGYETLEDGEGSFRDILKDPDEALRLEREARQVKDADTADALLRQNLADLETHPTNAKLLQKTADLYALRGDLDQALAHCQRAADALGGADPDLDQRIAELRLQQFDARIGALSPEDPDFDAKRQALQREKNDARLADQKARVERYPNDLQLRFQLAETHYQRGDVTDAIREFQKAQAAPGQKTKSLLRLGQLFHQRGMNDLAARSLENALSEKEAFDDEKKELAYTLGCVLETIGRTEDAMDRFKSVYEIDIEYRDVAEKVDAYYQADAHKSSL